MREHDLQVGGENGAPRIRPMELVWAVIALGLFLYQLGAFA